MVKIGDRVRFLNAMGGGIVRSFINKETVYVEEDDGFETPVLVKECVVIQTAGEISSLKGDKFSGSEIVLDNDRPTVIKETKTGDSLNIALVFLRDNSKTIDIKKADTYIVNDSNYWIMYSYMSLCDNGKWKLRHAGVAEPNMKYHMECISKEDLNDLERVAIQYTAFKKDKEFDKKHSGDIEIRIDTTKFYKINCFVKNDYFDQDAIVYPVVKDDVFNNNIKILHSKIEDSLNPKGIDIVKAKKPVSQIREKNGILEIDLHIDNLLETTAGMSNRAMLEYQLDTVEKVIESNKAKGGLKIVFIHGKGEGVLRKELLKLLSHKFKKYPVQDASFREYGYGATMITIK